MKTVLVSLVLLLASTASRAQSIYDAYLTQFATELTAASSPHKTWTYKGCAQIKGSTWYDCSVAGPGLEKTVLHIPSLDAKLTVVFVGDSISDLTYNVLMPDVATLSSSIGGEHCSALLQRFYEVLALAPQAVVIGCGDSDVYNPQPSAQGAILSMIASAQNAHIGVVVASTVPPAPVSVFPNSPTLNVAVIAQNLRNFSAWQRTTASNLGIPFWNKWLNLAGSTGNYGPLFCYGTDDIHPTNCEATEIATARYLISQAIAAAVQP